MTEPVVFFFEAFVEEEQALRSHLPDSVRAEFTAATIQEYGAVAPPAPLISTRTQSVIPVDWASRLSGILTRSTGFDHLSRYLSAAGSTLRCGYLPLYCNRSVAEHALLLWMALLRRLPLQRSRFAQFERDGLTGRECCGRTLLVVGVGNIGSEVVRIGEGLGMRVLGVDVVERWPDVTYVGIESGIAAADVIVCAMNLTDSNAGYFSRRLLSGVKQGAVFVNVARGEFSDASVLLSLLDADVLGGVGLDVYNNEPELAVSLRTGCESDSAEVAAALRLARHPRVICTPHNAFNTEEAVARKSSQSVEQVVHFLTHGEFAWAVPAG